MDALVRTVVYSGIPVWEVQVGPISVVRKQTDHSINLTQFLNVLGVHRQRREEFLGHYRSLPLAHCWVVHGGPARLKGTWGPFGGIKGLVAELGQQELFALLLDENLVPDMALVAAVPAAATSANAGVPVVPRRPAGTVASGSTKVTHTRPNKRQAVRWKQSGSTSSSDLSSISDSDLTDFDDDGEEIPASRPVAPRRSGLRQHAPLRSGTRASARHVESRKGKEREQLASDAEMEHSVEPTSSLEHVEEFLPKLLPDVSVFQQLFAPNKSQNQAALAYLRDMKVPKLAPDYDESDGDESMQETTPKDSITIASVRIQGASSASSESSQHLSQPPPMPQSPSTLASRSKVDGTASMNLGQLFDLKLKQRQSKLAAVLPPVRVPASANRAEVSWPSPKASPAAAPKASAQAPFPVNFRKIQRPEPEIFGAGPFISAPSVGLLDGFYGAPPASASPVEAPAPPAFLHLAPMLPVVPAADYALAITRCPPLYAQLPN